jgi:flagellar protein FliT
MTGHQHILDTYGSISATTERMVDAAKNRDWDRLIALEKNCRALIETLKTADAGISPDALYVQRKAELIRKVLADDAEIRKFTEPWMTQLQAYLGNARQEYMLRRAYENDHGS